MVILFFFKYKFRRSEFYKTWSNFYFTALTGFNTFIDFNTKNNGINFDRIITMFNKKKTVTFPHIHIKAREIIACFYFNLKRWINDVELVEKERTHLAATTTNMLFFFYYDHHYH